MSVEILLDARLYTWKQMTHSFIEPRINMGDIIYLEMWYCMIAHWGKMADIL